MCRHDFGWLTAFPSALQTTQTAAVSEQTKGFNAASVYAGGSDGQTDIVSGLTIRASDGTTVSAGTNRGFYAQQASLHTIKLPSSTAITGVVGRKGWYFDSLSLAFRDIR